MVKFSDPRQKVTVSLPSFEGSEVVLYKTLTVGDQIDVRSSLPKDGDERLLTTLGILSALQKAIISWNFTEDDDTTPLPITVENLRRFPEFDIGKMFEAMTGVKMFNDDGTPVSEAQKKSPGSKS